MEAGGEWLVLKDDYSFESINVRDDNFRFLIENLLNATKSQCINLEYEVLDKKSPLTQKQFALLEFLDKNRSFFLLDEVASTEYITTSDEKLFIVNDGVRKESFFVLSNEEVKEFIKESLREEYERNEASEHISFESYFKEKYKDIEYSSAQPIYFGSNYTFDGSFIYDEVEVDFKIFKVE